MKIVFSAQPFGEAGFLQNKEKRHRGVTCRKSADARRIGGLPPLMRPNLSGRTSSETLRFEPAGQVAESREKKDERFQNGGGGEDSACVWASWSKTASKTAGDPLLASGPPRQGRRQRARLGAPCHMSRTGSTARRPERRVDWKAFFREGPARIFGRRA